MVNRIFDNGGLFDVLIACILSVKEEDKKHLMDTLTSFKTLQRDFKAGKSTGVPKETVGSTLREYSLEDKVTAIKHDAKIWVEPEDVFVVPRELPPIRNPSFQGTQTQIRPILNPPAKTRFQELIENLKESTYESFWNKQDGSVRDEVPGLPAGMISNQVTFGQRTPRDITVKELVNPPKTPYQVLWDSQVAHEYYRKSHNDYNPSERISRNYQDPYNPNYRFGSKTPYDPRGVWVRCACDWHKKEPVCFASKIQADYTDRVRPELGKSLSPNHNIDCVPKGHSFGRPSGRPLFDVEELLKDRNCPPCIFKRDFYKWMAAFNRFRYTMKNRSNKDFNYDDFYKRCAYWDREKTGYIPIEVFYDLCACEHITYQKEDVESLLRVLNILVDNSIDYRKFAEIINVNKPPITIMPFNDVPKHAQYYLTTNQAASCDYLIINNTGMRPAGAPSMRYDLSRPIIPPDGCRADLVHLGQYTSANALLNPSIYTQYGLSYRDFYMPRPAKMIRTLFEKVGYAFPGDSFEKLWKAGVELDQTGCVCVDTFKTLLKTHCPPPKISVDEQECENFF